MRLTPSRLVLLVGGATAAAPAAIADEQAILREGYRRYQGVCAHCHGPDGVGSTFAPGLLEPLAGRQAFASAVLGGVTGPAGAMAGFAGNPDVEPYLDAIYAYLAARAVGRLGRGRPRFGLAAPTR